MKEQFKLTIKGANIKEKDGEIVVSEINTKGEVVSERTLENIYNKIKNRSNLKLDISSDSLSFEETKDIINKFINKNVSFAITENKEF